MTDDPFAGRAMLVHSKVLGCRVGFLGQDDDVPVSWPDVPIFRSKELIGIAKVFPDADELRELFRIRQVFDDPLDPPLDFRLPPDPEDVREGPGTSAADQTSMFSPSRPSGSHWDD